MSNHTTGRRTVIKGATAAAVTALTPIGLATAQPAVPAAQPDDEPGVGRARGALGGFRPVEPILDRLQPPERAEHHLRAAGLLQRVRRQDAICGWRRATSTRPTSSSSPSRRVRGSSGATARRSRAEDVAFTLNSLRDLGPKVKWGVDVQQVLKEAKATDANTVVLEFKVPVAALLLLHDLQVRHRRLHRAEAHLRRPGLDDASSTSTSPRAGRSRPGRGRSSTPRCSRRCSTAAIDWWAADAKLAPMPQIERIIWLPYVGEQQTAQALITNQVDFGDRHAAGDVPDRVPAAIRRSPRTPGRSRRTATSIGGRSRSTSTTR